MTRPEVMGDLRLRAERAEARVAVLERELTAARDELANRRFVEAARGKPVMPVPDGWYRD